MMVGVFVGVDVHVGVGVFAVSEALLVQVTSKVRSTVSVPYIGPVTLLKLPVKVLVELAGCESGRGEALQTSGEGNVSFFGKIFVPLKFSCFKVWPGQPFAQEIFVWVRWMGTLLRFWTDIVNVPLFPSLMADIVTRPQLLVAVGVAVRDGVLVVVRVNVRVGV